MADEGHINLANSYLLKAHEGENIAYEYYKRAIELLKICKSWAKATEVILLFAECLKLYECELPTAYAQAYMDAAHCCLKENSKDSIKNAISYLEIAFDVFREHDESEAVKCAKEIAELYASCKNFKKAMEFYKSGADLLRLGTAPYMMFMENVAQIAIEMNNYQEAMKTYETMAENTLRYDFLKRGAAGHCLNAGICGLSGNDIDEIFINVSSALLRYKDMDSKFSHEWQCEIFEGIVDSIASRDVAKFNYVCEQYEKGIQPILVLSRWVLRQPCKNQSPGFWMSSPNSVETVFNLERIRALSWEFNGFDPGRWISGREN